MLLTDKYNRRINYLRLSVTDRCNLRCYYCMPEEGIHFERKKSLLTFEEIERLLFNFSQLGINKIRFTGGEPFVRKDFMHLLEKICSIQKIRSIHITTNGILIGKYIQQLKELGIKNINLSLDALDPNIFFKITRRDYFHTVMDTFHALIENQFNVKINAVILAGVNEQEIVPMSKLLKHFPIEIRFIEEMPFNGREGQTIHPCFTYKNIKKILEAEHGLLVPLSSAHGETSNKYNIKGYKGTVGIIPAFSRTFCNTCNRIRITAKGEIKTCLYDNGVFSFRDFLRSGVQDSDIQNKLIELVRAKPEDGFEAENQRHLSKTNFESMSAIGG